MSGRGWVALISLGAIWLATPAAAAEQTFRFKRPDAQSVGLCGEFNGWKAQPMTKNADGTWSITVSLPPGTYGYKFLVNGTDWHLDPTNSSRKTVDGIENSAVEVTSASGVSRTISSPTPAGAAEEASGTAANDRRPVDFEVVADRKRFDFDRSSSRHTTTTVENWGYKVTLTNRSFKPVSDLEVQYREFKLDDALRGARKLVGVAGSTKIERLDNGQRFTFETAPVAVERQELNAGWFYADGAREKVKDALAGLWIRVVRGGEVLFEWQSPPDLKTRAKWD